MCRSGIKTAIAKMAVPARLAETGYEQAPRAARPRPRGTARGLVPRGPPCPAGSASGRMQAPPLLAGTAGVEAARRQADVQTVSASQDAWSSEAKRLRCIHEGGGRGSFCCPWTWPASLGERAAQGSWEVCVSLPRKLAGRADARRQYAPTYAQGPERRMTPPLAGRGGTPPVPGRICVYMDTYIHMYIYIYIIIYRYIYIYIY